MVSSGVGDAGHAGPWDSRWYAVMQNTLSGSGSGTWMIRRYRSAWVWPMATRKNDTRDAVQLARLYRRGTHRATKGVLRLLDLVDWRRFESPRQLMAYLGLVPWEHSSGDRERSGSLTKAGNTHRRRTSCSKYVVNRCSGIRADMPARPDLGASARTPVLMAWWREHHQSVSLERCAKGSAGMGDLGARRWAVQCSSLTCCCSR